MCHPARGYATGFASPAIAVPPAPTFGLDWPWCALTAACAASCARGSVGYLKAVCSLRSIAPRPLRGKSQAIQHNSALPKVGPVAPLKLRLVARPLARPAGSGNGLLCLAPLRGQLRHSALRVVSVSAAHRWPTFNRSAALPRLTARSLTGCAG